MASSREKNIKSIMSREYKIYREEERQTSLPRTLYEKACNASVKMLVVKPDKKTYDKFKQAIDFAHLKTTPEGVMSFTFSFLILGMVIVLTLMALDFMKLPGLPLGYGVMALFILLFFTYYLYLYPLQLKRRYEMSVGSEVVTMILYIVMFMRNTPSLEAAVKFAAENIKGDLGYELKKLLWDVEVGNYLSMEEALLDYSKKWQSNKPFIEAVQMVITSMRQVGPKRAEVLEESVRIILDGNREQAKNFNQNLKMPVTIINALGVVLPVMGLVLFPIVAVFLNVDASLLFVGYDIMLPLLLYFVITSVMELRPATFSKIDITENPDMPPPGKFKMGNKFVKAWPIGLAVTIAVFALGVFLYYNELASVKDPKDFEGIIPAVVMTMAISLGASVYFILLSYQRLGLRSKTRQIEDEFAEALFQLGNQVSGGIPLELSIEHSMDRIKNLKIRELFQRALRNMKMMGMTFQQAFFDEKYGATRYYPSRMIKSVMRTVVESSKKGVLTAASAMISIAKYLKGLHDTQEEVKESLSDTLNSIKFQAFFLTPLISGIVGTLAIIIIQIIRGIGQTAPAIGASDVLGSFSQVSITPFQFIMIVSIYMVETAFILGTFINTIENGDDEIGFQNTVGYTLLIGFIVFAVSLIMTLAVFKPLVSSVI